VAVKDREKDVKKFKGKFDISSPLLIDDRARVANAYGVWGHPMTFFINRDGKIVARAFGGKDWTSDSMRNLIQYLLSKPTSFVGG
jgi:cytochrome c biogenesis protein CcmG/thiol:disulfide interchange protein DsbE